MKQSSTVGERNTASVDTVSFDSASRPDAGDALPLPMPADRR
jgi:hypothetical protein